MKLGIFIVAALLAAIASSAAAADNDPITERAWMVYVTKSFGGDSRSAPPPMTFGLRLQQSAIARPERPVVLMNAGLRTNGVGTLSFGGVTALRFSGGSDSGNSSEPSSEVARLHPGWTAVAIVAAVLAGACIAREVICEDDNGRPYREPTTPSPSNPG